MTTPMRLLIKHAPLLEQIALVVAYGVVITIIVINTAIRYERTITAQQLEATRMRSQPPRTDLGEHVYLMDTGAVLDAIRAIEGVPSYGVMTLATLAGRHQLVSETRGRLAAKIIVSRIYHQWQLMGRPGSFFTFLRNRYCGSATMGCQYWLGNLVTALPDELLAEAAREELMK